MLPPVKISNWREASREWRVALSPQKNVRQQKVKNRVIVMRE